STTQSCRSTLSSSRRRTPRAWDVRFHSTRRLWPPRPRMGRPRPTQQEGGSMNELIAFGGGLARRQARAAGQELARIGFEGHLQAERVSAVAYVSKRALHEVTMVSQTEVQLAAMVPAAATRLQAIADFSAAAMAEVVAETVRKVR